MKMSTYNQAKINYSEENKKNITEGASIFSKDIQKLSDNIVEEQVINVVNNAGWESRFYIIDFFDSKKRIAFEIDGGYHETRIKEDAERTKALNAIGITVIRFSNEDVKLGNHRYVLNLIYNDTKK